MKIKRFIPILFILSSCGLTNNIAHRNLDNSPNWENNYYSSFRYAEEDIIRVNNYELDTELDYVFTSYNSDSFKAVEPNRDSYSYYGDLESNGYGHNFKLSEVNSNVKNGFTSKLFDGQMFCHHYYEKARIQIKQEGLNDSFSSTLKEASYIALSFKASLNFKQHIIPSHKSTFNIYISLYKNSETGIIEDKYSYTLNDVLTNGGETYLFYGFSLSRYDVSNVIGYGISYSLISDEYLAESGEEVSYALLLYELFIANSTWER